jgi:hypothetical protein
MLGDDVTCRQRLRRRRERAVIEGIDGASAPAVFAVAAAAAYGQQRVEQDNNAASSAAAATTAAARYKHQVCVTVTVGINRSEGGRGRRQLHGRR